MASPEAAVQTEMSTPKEFPPEKSKVRNDWIDLTARIAVGAREEVIHRGTLSEQLAKNPKGDKKAIKTELIFDLDTMAADNTEAGVTLFPYVTNIISFEGHKEKDAKKLGKVPKMLSGEYGEGECAIGVDMDPIEGTDAVADNLPGGMSFTSISSVDGIMSTPKDEKGEDIDYMEKLFGPPRLKGKLSLEKSYLENLQAVADEYGIDPSQITVTYLNRERNRALIDAVEQFGAQADPIEYGDLEPALASLIEPEDVQKEGVHLMWGSGGWQEGVGVAVGAKAIGAFAEARIMEKQKDENGDEIFIPHENVLSLDEIVPGERQHCMVVLSAVTECPRIGMQAVDMHKREVSSFVLDAEHPRGLRVTQSFDELL